MYENSKRETAQQQLNELYHEYFIKRVQEEDHKELLSKLSTPLLISIPENYFNGKRIWFVGQDTYEWYGRYEETFLKNSNPIEYATNSYRDFFKNLKNDSPIWQYFFKLFGENRNSVIHNNIYKCDHIEGYGKWYTASHMRQQVGHTKKLEKLISFQQDIFCKELEILKPDLVILMSSKAHDKVAFEKCFDEGLRFESVNSDINSNIFGKIVPNNRYFPDETYRTYHPRYLSQSRHLSKEQKDFIFDFLHKKVERSGIR